MKEGHAAVAIQGGILRTVSRHLACVHPDNTVYFLPCTFVYSYTTAGLFYELSSRHTSSTFSESVNAKNTIKLPPKVDLRKARHRNSSVTTWMIGVRFPTDKYLSLFHQVHISSRAHAASSIKNTMGKGRTQIHRRTKQNIHLQLVPNDGMALTDKKTF